MDYVKTPRPKSPKYNKTLNFSELAQCVDKEVPQTISFNEYRELELKFNQALAEIDSLKQLLSKVNVVDFALPVSDEEEIASIQLARLKTLSRERQLSLEEVKILDYLVKNKRLAKEDATEIISTKDLPKNLDKPQLIQIAKVKNAKD